MVMTFDLGVEAPVARFRLNERSNCCQEKSPKVFQIWATNDIATGAGTISIKQGQAAWEADAAAKGWVKLLDVTDNSATSPDVTFPNTIPYRYVRYVGISSINGESDANYAEFTFWKK